MQKNKPKFTSCVLQTGLFLVGFMLLNVLKKVLFRQSDFNSLKESLGATNQPLQALLITIVILIVGLLLLSLLFGSIYYGIKMLIYKKSLIS